MPDTTLDATTDPIAQDPVTSTQPGDSAATQQVENQPAGGSRTYTQEEVDRIVKGRIDKQNQKHRAELEKVQKTAQDAEEHAAAAAKDAADLKAMQARQASVASAAAKHGVNADILARMAGTTDEEIEANAALLAEAMPKAAYPSIADNGNQPTSTLSKDDIKKVKNPTEQHRLIKENIDLFK